MKSARKGFLINIVFIISSCIIGIITCIYTINIFIIKLRVFSMRTYIIQTYKDKDYDKIYLDVYIPVLSQTKKYEISHDKYVYIDMSTKLIYYYYKNKLIYTEHFKQFLKYYGDIPLVPQV